MCYSGPVYVTLVQYVLLWSIMCYQGSDAGSWVEESRHQRRNLSRDFSDSSFSNILNITTGDR